MWRVCLERNIEKYFRSVFLVWISTYVLKMSTLKKWNKRNANYFHVLFYCTKDKTVWMTLVYTSILFFHVQLISFGKVLMRKHLFVYVMDILKKIFLKKNGIRQTLKKGWWNKFVIETMNQSHIQTAMLIHVYIRSQSTAFRSPFVVTLEVAFFNRKRIIWISEEKFKVYDKFWVIKPWTSK